MQETSPPEDGEVSFFVHDKNKSGNNGDGSI